MDQETHEAIQKRGANARAAGLDKLANPYLKADAMPAATGEDLTEWVVKHDAWHLGWTMEDAMRG